MSHVDPGPLSSYNSLADPHLSGFFSNTRMKKYLCRQGLITRRGQIVSESTYRINMARKEHKKHVKNLLASAIVHKTLDMERHRQVEIKRKLEEIAKIELVRRVRASTTGNKSEENLLPLLANSARAKRGRPVSGPTPRSKARKQRSSRPYSAPAKDNKLHANSGREGRSLSNDDGRPESRRGARHRERGMDELTKHDLNKNGLSNAELDTRNLTSLDTVALRKYAYMLSKHEQGVNAVSPYLMPQVGYRLPSPPKSPRGTARSRNSRRRHQSPRDSLSARSVSPGQHQARGDDPKGSPRGDKVTVDGQLIIHRQEPAMKGQEKVQSFCTVSIKYHGKKLVLPKDQVDPYQEVLVEQQHCGGNTLHVFKEKLLPGSTFRFISRRHRGYPFSLSLYIDGLMDCRVSSCCEYKHVPGSKLGGKQGHFSLVGVTGSAPCYRCQVEKELRLQRKTKKKSKTKAEATSHEDQEEVTQEAEKEEEETNIVPVEESDSEGETTRSDNTPKEVDVNETADDKNEYEEDFEDEDEDKEEKSKEKSDEESDEEDKKVEDEAPLELIHGEVEEETHQRADSPVPVFGAPAGDAPAGDAPAGDAPIGDAPAGDASNKAMLSPDKQKQKMSENDYQLSDGRKIEGYSSEEEYLDKDHKGVAQVEIHESADSHHGSLRSRSSSSSSSSSSSGSHGSTSPRQKHGSGSSSQTEDSSSEYSEETSKTSSSPYHHGSSSQHSSSIHQHPSPSPSPSSPSGSLLSRNEQAASLALAGVNLDQKKVKEICHHVEKNDQLEEVTLRNVELGELEIQRLAFSLKQSAGGLKVLNFVQNNLDAIGASKIAEVLKVKPSIESLSLAGNPISDEGMKALVDGLLRIHGEEKQSQFIKKLELEERLSETEAARDLTNQQLVEEEEEEVPKELTELMGEIDQLEEKVNRIGQEEEEGNDGMEMQEDEHRKVMEKHAVSQFTQEIIDQALRRAEESFSGVDYTGEIKSNDKISTADKGDEEPVTRASASSITEERFCHLRELDVQDVNITDMGVGDLAVLLAQNTRLRSLNIAGNKLVSVFGWRRLAKGLEINSNLERLSLDHCPVGDYGIEVLAEAIKDNACLRVFSLVCCGLTEHGGRCLVDLLKRNTYLTDINLMPGNDISDHTLSEIRNYLALNQNMAASPQ